MNFEFTENGWRDLENLTIRKFQPLKQTSELFSIYSTSAINNFHPISL